MSEKPKLPDLISFNEQGQPMIQFQTGDQTAVLETVLRVYDYATLGRTILSELSNFRALGYLANLHAAGESGIMSTAKQLAVNAVFHVRPPRNKAEGSAALAEALFLRSLHAQQEAQKISTPAQKIILPA